MMVSFLSTLNQRPLCRLCLTEQNRDFHQRRKGLRMLGSNDYDHDIHPTPSLFATTEFNQQANALHIWTLCTPRTPCRFLAHMPASQCSYSSEIYQPPFSLRIHCPTPRCLVTIPDLGITSQKSQNWSSHGLDMVTNSCTVLRFFFSAYTQHSQCANIVLSISHSHNQFQALVFTFLATSWN